MLGFIRLRVQRLPEGSGVGPENRGTSSYKYTGVKIALLRPQVT